MTQAELKTNLADKLQRVAEFLEAVAEADWHRSQNGKWTIGQEFEHLRMSTQGMAFLLSVANRPNWRPTDRTSREYQAFLSEYQAAIAAIRDRLPNNPAAPSVESDALTVAQQAQRWAKTTQQVLGVFDSLAEPELEGSTVWKHPLLGPVTAREVLYFTTFHTQHHHGSMVRKLTYETK